MPRTDGEDVADVLAVPLATSTLQRLQKETNDLDDDSVDEVVVGKLAHLNIGKDKEAGEEEEEEEEKNGDVVYTPKGPIRRQTKEGSVAPYGSRPAAIGVQDEISRSFDEGQFVDVVEEVLGVIGDDFGLPGLPHRGGPRLTQHLDEIFVGAAENSWIIIRRPDEEGIKGDSYDYLPTTLSIVIDEKLDRIGIKVPRQVLPLSSIPRVVPEDGKIPIFVQLDSRASRIIRCRAAVERKREQVSGRECWTMKSQFLRLQPFHGPSSLGTFLDGVTDQDLETAKTAVSRHSLDNLVKVYEPNKDTNLTVLCCQTDSPLGRAKILALIKKLLAHPDPKLRQQVTLTNKVGSSALDFTALTNKTVVTRFLAEIFYILGADLYAADSQGNTLLHILARKGDEVADTLEALLDLNLRDDCRKVYQSEIARNKKGELPIHIAAKNDKCHHRTIQLLRKDFPECFSAPIDRGLNAGNLPLHHACQYSTDPALVATILYYHRAAVNVCRDDGFTPLHLVASRRDLNTSLGLVALSASQQIRMLELLLEHGADKSVSVGGYLAVQLLHHERVEAAKLLRITSGKCSPRESSPNSESPTSQVGEGISQPPPLHNRANMSPSESSGNFFTGSPVGEQQLPHFLMSPFGNGSLTSGHRSNSDESNDSNDSNYSNGSNESNENNLSQEQLDAIANLLCAHPAIEAAILATEDE